MLNVIPGFISDKLRKGKFQGTIQGSTVLVDISGFTSLSESLMFHGKPGAEILSSIINSVFDPAIRNNHKNNHKYGGFISAFAGEASEMLRILPGLSCLSALDIQKTFAYYSGLTVMC